MVRHMSMSCSHLVRILLRSRSHYGENHDDSDGNIYSDGKKRGELVTLTTSFSGTKKKWCLPCCCGFTFCRCFGIVFTLDYAGIVIAALHLLFIASRLGAGAIVHERACSSTPCCSPPVPGTSTLYSCSTAFPGSTKGVGFVGERLCLLWRTEGRKYPDWEDAQYRMSAQTSISFLSVSESHLALGFLPLVAIAHFFACADLKRHLRLLSPWQPLSY